MLVITAEKRNGTMKAKHIRKSGMTPANLYGSGIKDSIPFQLAQGEVAKLQRLRSVDVAVTLNIEGEKTVALLREISVNPLRTHVENVCFQKLAEDELISSTTRIILANSEIPLARVNQEIYDLPYKALGSKLVEELTIDLKGCKIGDVIRVKDLEIANNKDLDILVDLDRPVVSILEKGGPSRQTSEEE